MLCDVAKVGACFGIVYHGTTRNLDDFILTILAATLVLGAVPTMTSEGMAVVAQVEEGPIVAVATQDDVSATAAITTVGASVRVVLHAAHVRATATSLARTAIYFYVIDEIRFCHGLYNRIYIFCNLLNHTFES